MPSDGVAEFAIDAETPTTANVLDVPPCRLVADGIVLGGLPEFVVA